MTAVPLDQRLALVRRHGRFSQAYSAAVQAGLEHFGDARGFIAFRRLGGTAMVLSDPVVSEEHRPALVAEFVDRHRDVCFCEVSRPVAVLLESMGFSINEMGLETRIDLAGYSFEGRKKRTLRRAVNRLDEQGFVIRECPMGDLDPADVALVSDRWRRTRALRYSSVRFLNRPIVLHDEPDVRKFFAFDPGGRLMAFEFFDPIFSHGAAIAYLDAFRRRLPETDPLVNYAILHRAIETFQREGRQWLSLGLSPMAEIDNQDFKKNWWVKRGFRFAYSSRLFNRFVYPLQGIAANKREFGGSAAQTYFALNTMPALPRLVKLMRVCGLIGLSLRE
jgi:phosphatidylglycerol lysyltransferase